MDELFISDLRALLSDLDICAAFLELAYHSSTLHAYEINLINPFAYRRPPEPTGNDTADMQDASARILVLRYCLEAAKDYFETFLTIPASQYQLLASVQWYSLIYATIVVYKLSLGLPKVPEWDIAIARSFAPLDVYLDTCIERMKIACSPSGADFSAYATDRHDLFSLLVPIWESVRATFHELSRLPEEQSAIIGGAAHETRFFDMAISAKRGNGPRLYGGLPQNLGHRCPAYPFWHELSPDSTT